MATVIQLRGDTSANRASVNPILADRELVVETDTRLQKLGDGVNPYNDLPYLDVRPIAEATVLTMENQAVPTPPGSGKLNVFARNLGGRMALRMQGPSGLSTPLQPSFFQNNITIINTNATSSITSSGNTATSVGTISHPAITLLYGYMTNFASAATANATAGSGNTTVLWTRSTNPSDASGFFFNARLGFSDSNYNETGAGTGSRVFVGLTSNTLAVSVGTNDPLGTRVGFSRLHVNGSTTDTNWFITSKNTTEERIDTGILFSAECVYDFYLFCPPDGSFIGWRIDNVTLGTTAEGIITTQLPTIGTYMRGGFQVQTVNAINRNIRMQRVYIESDR